ncbi:hypothetical protein [Microvirga flavescens]|uniref:hypothetical protein n=1 Tax=Microvirga flavescens TaxID=2249811 RepID=UPI001300544E|nr:hypothetical protein [Microvirga flavescens]
MTALRKYNLTEDDLPEFESPLAASSPAYRPLTAAIMRKWRRQLSLDRELNALSHRIAHWIGARIDLAKGYVEVSATDLATELEICDRTAQYGLAKLGKCRHLAKEVRRGRGRDNRYWPVIHD